MLKVYEEVAPCLPLPLSMIKLTCGDGVVLRLPHEHFEKSVFNNPEIVVARSYTLQCEARSEMVNAVLDVADETTGHA